MKPAYQLLDYLPDLFRFLRPFQSQELRGQALAFVQFIPGTRLSSNKKYRCLSMPFFRCI